MSAISSRETPALLPRDPVCGMGVSPLRADAITEWRGQRFLFCSEQCQREFERDPARFVVDAVRSSSAEASTPRRP